MIVEGRQLVDARADSFRVLEPEYVAGLVPHLVFGQLLSH